MAREVRRLSDAERIAWLTDLTAAIEDLGRLRERVAGQLVDSGTPVEQVAEALGVSVATWYRWQQRRGAGSGE